MLDAMGSHLSNARWDVLEVGLQNTTSGIQGAATSFATNWSGSSCSIKATARRKGSSGEDQKNKVVKYTVVLKNLPMILASDVASCARIALVSLSAAVRVA